MNRVNTEIEGLSYVVRPSKTDPKKRDRVWHGRFRDRVTGKQREVVLGWRDYDGMSKYAALEKLIKFRRGEESTGSEKRAAAEILKIEEKATSLQGLWENYSQHFDSRKGKHNYEKSIHNADNCAFRKHILPVLGKKKPSEYTDVDVNKLSKSVKSKGLKPQTVKHILGLLRRILRHNGIDLKFEMPIVNNLKDDENLTENQLKSLLDTLRIAENRQVADMMLMILNTGMRQGEVRKLRWKHINWNKKSINIIEPKGGTDVNIPLTQGVEEILKRQRPQGTIPHSNSPVFPGNRPDKTKGDISGPARYIADQAGLPKSFRPCHGLRHFFLTQLVASGVDIDIVRRMAGHANISTTQRYLDCREDDMKKAAEIMNKRIQDAI